MTLEEQIQLEFSMYLEYCRKASLHDEFEAQYRAMAHKVFYHLQELRTTKIQSILGKVSG